jgi:hypothetical protein
MRTLKNIFGDKETKKNINNFLNDLDFIAMSKIKGGEDEDLWPPKSTDGSGTSGPN